MTQWRPMPAPAGSVVVWSESTVHMGNAWTDTQEDRMAVLQAYNALCMQFSWARATHEQIMRMPPRRRSLFRAPWQTRSVASTHATLKSTLYS
jgi:hypothetical protein